MIKKCAKCGQEKEHHAKGLCYGCYRNLAWEPKKGICKRCGREKQIHAKNLCRGCYNFTFNLNYNKIWSRKKLYGIDDETYKKATKTCIICGFDKIVDLHHIDQNNQNNSEDNLVGLCPNHHKMLHDYRYREEMFNLLKEKGFNIPEDKKLNFKLR